MISKEVSSRISVALPGVLQGNRLGQTPMRGVSNFLVAQCSCSANDAHARAPTGGQSCLPSSPHSNPLLLTENLGLQRSLAPLTH